MTLQEKILFGAAVVVVAIVAMFGVLKLSSGKATTFGAVGGMLAEHYLPFVMANGGYNSALPIVTTGTFSAASTTVTGQVNLTKPTLCFNFYATSTATSLYMVASTTGTLPVGSAAVLTANYGTCAN
jgi:hypothetical protein